MALGLLEKKQQGRANALALECFRGIFCFSGTGQLKKAATVVRCLCLPPCFGGISNREGNKSAGVRGPGQWGYEFQEAAGQAPNQLPAKPHLGKSISSNSIGSYKDFTQTGYPVISTPEGMELISITPYIHSKLMYCLHHRSCCYRQCHQGYGGVDEAHVW
jgi:hypothetical protein